MSQKGTLYLFPVTLGNSVVEDVLPKRNIDLIKQLTFFIAENAKEARAFLKQCQFPDISKAQFSLINQHVKQEELNLFINPLLQGQDMGLMSDAGCPGIADPGADIIKLAHKQGIKVGPLVGPSSIVLSIMASGFNGQNFAFNGYLPIEKPTRLKRIKELELLTQKNKQAQYFIETPYRNTSLFQDLIQQLQAHTKLLIASALTTNDEVIMVKTVQQWKREEMPQFNKVPTVFGIYSE